MKKALPIVFVFLVLLAAAVVVFIRANGDISYTQQGNDSYDYYVKVVGVADGDTFTGLTDKKEQIRFRIHGIDAPERAQPFGAKSRKYLSSLIYGERVGIKIRTASDQYGRPVVHAITPDGKDAGAEMLRAGLAWHYSRYDDSEEYSQLELESRKAKKGLWHDKNPMAPWNFRRMPKVQKIRM